MCAPYSLLSVFMYDTANTCLNSGAHISMQHPDYAFNWIAFLHLHLDEIIERFWSEILETCELCIHCFLIMWVLDPARRVEWTLNLDALLTNWIASLHLHLDEIIERFWNGILETCELCLHCFLIMWVLDPARKGQTGPFRAVEPMDRNRE